MKKIIFLTTAIVFSNFSYSQEKYNPLDKPNTYRNIDDPN